MAFENNFKQLLTDFFSLYHPRQVKKVDKIAEEFKGNEVEVFNHLCAKYRVSKSKVPGLIEAEEAKKLQAQATPEPVVEEVQEEEAEQESEENDSEEEENTEEEKKD